MTIESITRANVESGFDKTERLLRMAKEGLHSGANEEVFSWQESMEFDSDYSDGIREDLVNEFGGNPFDRASWCEHGGYFYLEDDEKSRFGSYQEYVDFCDNQCRDIFRAIVDSLVEYKDYLRSIAE